MEDLKLGDFGQQQMSQQFEMFSEFYSDVRGTADNRTSRQIEIADTFRHEIIASSYLFRNISLRSK